MIEDDVGGSRISVSISSFASATPVLSVLCRMCVPEVLIHATGDAKVIGEIHVREVGCGKFVGGIKVVRGHCSNFRCRMANCETFLMTF